MQWVVLPRREYADRLVGGAKRCAATAFVVPALALPARALLLALRHQAVYSAGVALALSAAAWVFVAVALRPVRRLLADLGEWLVLRVPFPALLLGALVAAATVHSLVQSPLRVVLSIALLALAVAGVVHRWRRDRRRCLFVFVLIAYDVALLVGADAVARVLVLPAMSHNSVFVVHDSRLGWKLRPGAVVERHDVKYRSHETVNALGFRGRLPPLAREPGTRRVVAIGDSYTEGYTCDDGHTWPEQLERTLAQRAPAQVVAFGVGGWSTDQEYLAWLHLARDFRPDVVLLQFCANDPPYNVRSHYWQYRKPRFRRFGEELLLDGAPVPDERLSFAQGTFLARFAIARALEVGLARWRIRQEQEDRVPAEEPWLVTRLLLRAFSRSVAADGARFVVFDASSDDAECERRLRELCHEESIDFVDVAPAFGDDLAEHRVANDLHWNERGHAAVAELLAREVEARLGPSVSPR